MGSVSFSGFWLVLVSSDGFWWVVVDGQMFSPAQPRHTPVSSEASRGSLGWALVRTISALLSDVCQQFSESRQRSSEKRVGRVISSERVEHVSRS